MLLSPTNVHGMLVHFPIALLFVSVFLDFVALHPRLRIYLQPAALITLLLGAVAAGLAVASGPDNNARGVTPLVHLHENMADLTLILFGALALWRLFLLWRRRPLGRITLATYLLLALVGLGILSYTGYLGGEMVYQQAIGVSKNGQLISPPVTGPFNRGG